MGTDIHFYVERRVGAVWESADKWTPDKYAEEGEAPRLTVDYHDHFYRDRNYHLFSILADVRNGHGFAGIKTGEGFVPICTPRGQPSDMSELLKAEAESYGGHTPSWLTVAEIMAYDWTQVTSLCGYVTPAQYWDWGLWRRKEGRGPKNYFGGRTGVGIKDVSEDHMRQIIEAADLNSFGNYEAKRQALALLDRNQTHVSWTEPYHQCADEFLANTLPRLWRLGKPEDVRCVFWFDS